ncbi:MAG: MFS transporter [Thermoplasmata archaeon]|nr:MFS transporter [Thermoplasmata archaeon]
MEKKLDKNIVLLGLISFFTDMSSEAIMPILPFFISQLEGAKIIGVGLAVGLIMGIGDATASITNFVSGIVSDRVARRKVFITAGYTISASSKLLFPFSSSWWHMLIFRGIERAGKGIRSAPRDALIGEMYEKQRGHAFGFHRMMDTAGAVTGSIIAFILFWYMKMEIKTILLIAALLAFFAIPPILFVKEGRGMKKEKKFVINSKMKKFVIIATLFYLGNFSYAFLLLRTKDIMLSHFSILDSVAITFLMYAFFNIIYASLSPYFGKLSDRIGRRNIIVSGYLLFAVICSGFLIIPFIFAGEIIIVILLFALYGVMFSMIEANQRAYVADIGGGAASQGVFKAFTGMVAIPSGIIAGALWDISSNLTFIYGLALSLVSAILLYTWMEKN